VNINPTLRHHDDIKSSIFVAKDALERQHLFAIKPAAHGPTLTADTDGRHCGPTADIESRIKYFLKTVLNLNKLVDG